VKHANSLEDVERAADVLWQKVPVLVIKRGSQGALVLTAKEKLMNFPPVVNVADHVGAGDNFDAGFVHQYIRGTSIEDCLKFANIVGSLSVTRPGGTEAFRDAQHRESFLRSHPVGGTRGASPTTR
jgi:sugar/nucleoside kinase (ribokinase family)